MFTAVEKGSTFPCLQKQQQHFLTLPEMTHRDASFALKMIKRAPSLWLTVVEISWAGG